MASKGSICVTGASGFIGSWIVKLLLERGYKVRGTVQAIGEAMDGATERLELLQMELLNYDSVEAAVSGSVGVFHVASPCIVGERVDDPQAQLLDPAIKGTKNVMQAAHKAKVKRVVVTSSISAIRPNAIWPEDVQIDESFWTDDQYCKEHEMWYAASKTLSEKAAWDFARETGLDVVVINPGITLGPVLSPSINASMTVLLNRLKGNTGGYQSSHMNLVHVRDVAEGHIMLYENASASGRHLCVGTITHWNDFADMAARLYPQYTIYRFTYASKPGLVKVNDASKKVIALGLNFTPMEDIIRDSVNSLQEKGLLKNE